MTVLPAAMRKDTVAGHTAVEEAGQQQGRCSDKTVYKDYHLQLRRFEVSPGKHGDLKSPDFLQDRQRPRLGRYGRQMQPKSLLQDFFLLFQLLIIHTRP